MSSTFAGGGSSSAAAIASVVIGAEGADFQIPIGLSDVSKAAGAAARSDIMIVGYRRFRYRRR